VKAIEYSALGDNRLLILEGIPCFRVAASLTALT
jgi:hypothetical protein